MTRRQKRGNGRTAVLITKCTPELRRAIEADARARDVTIGRAMVERLTAGLAVDTKLRRVCAWFHDPIPIDGLGPVADDAELSHGMCDECAARAMKGENQ